MPTLIRDFPNELILILASHASPSTLLSLTLLSHRFHSLLHSSLRSRASSPETSRAAIYWAVLTKDRPLAKFILKNATNIAVVRSRRLLCQRGRRKPIPREYVYHRAPEECPDEVLDWIMEQGLLLSLKDDGASEVYNIANTRPIDYAINNLHPALIRLILRYSSKGDGWSILKHAIPLQKQEALGIILEHERSTCDEAGYRATLAEALIIAVQPGRVTRGASTYDMAKMLRFLFARGTDLIAERDEAGHVLGDSRHPTTGMSLLHLAVTTRAPDAVLVLLENGVDINARDPQGQTALHVAATYSNPEVIKVLLQNGAQVDCRDSHGYTPLLTANVLYDGKSVRILLEHGADVNARENHGVSALHRAADFNKNYRVGCCGPMLPVGSQEEMLRLLLENGADVNAQDENGSSVLHVAAARYVSGGGPHSPVRTERVRGWTTAQEAVVELLKEKGADVTLKDNEGRTAFA